MSTYIALFYVGVITCPRQNPKTGIAIIAVSKNIPLPWYRNQKSIFYVKVCATSVPVHCHISCHPGPSLLHNFGNYRRHHADIPSLCRAVHPPFSSATKCVDVVRVYTVKLKRRIHFSDTRGTLYYHSALMLSQKCRKTFRQYKSSIHSKAALPLTW